MKAFLLSTLFLSLSAFAGSKPETMADIKVKDGNVYVRDVQALLKKSNYKFDSYYVEVGRVHSYEREHSRLDANEMSCVVKQLNEIAKAQSSESVSLEEREFFFNIQLRYYSYFSLRDGISVFNEKSKYFNMKSQGIAINFSWDSKKCNFLSSERIISSIKSMIKEENDKKDALTKSIKDLKNLTNQINVASSKTKFELNSRREDKRMEEFYRSSEKEPSTVAKK